MAVRKARSAFSMFGCSRAATLVSDSAEHVAANATPIDACATDLREIFVNSAPLVCQARHLTGRATNGKRGDRTG